MLGAVFLIVFGVGAFYAYNAQASSIPWAKDLTSAFERAKNEKKPVLTYLFTDWCSFCKQMESDTLKDPLLTRDMADEYVWVRLNAEKDPVGERLRAEFQLVGYPTIVIMDPQGSEIDRLQGYYPAPKFKEIVETLLASPTSFGEVKKAALENPDSMTARYALGEKYVERNDYPKAAREFAYVVGHDPENRSRLADASQYFFAFSLASGGRPEEALEQMDVLEQRFPESRFLADAAVLRGQIHYYAGETRQAKAVFDKYLQDYPQHENRFWVAQIVKEIAAEELPLARSH